MLGQPTIMGRADVHVRLKLFWQTCAATLLEYGLIGGQLRPAAERTQVGMMPSYCKYTSPRKPSSVIR